jgi:RNA polymerase sigma-70 factor (ECF subfamily)
VPLQVRRAGRPVVAVDECARAAHLYEQLGPAVMGYLRAQRAEEPEDLLQEVFVQVVRDLPRFVGDGDGLRRWLFAIAHNRLIDGRRRRASRLRTEPSAAARAAVAEAGHGGLDVDLLEALQAAVQGQNARRDA